MPVVNNGVESYRGDQLVVEQGYAGLVTRELRRLQIAASELDSDDRLGLVLLNLPDVATAAASLRSDPALGRIAGPGQQAPGQPAAGLTDLDRLLLVLRDRFRQAHHGWVPTFGKNRILGRVQGSPYIKGGVGLPDPAGPFTSTPFVEGGAGQPAPAGHHTIIPPYIKGGTGQPDPAGPFAIPPASGQPGARVAVLDTRLYAHPDLIGRFIGDSVTGFSQRPRTTQGHATFVAGLIARRAPDAELLVSTVLDDDGANASSWDLATAMARVLDAGAAVLNLSLGCMTADAEPPMCLRRAVERLAPSVVIVAAAGNNGAPDAAAAAVGLTANTPVYPAALDDVVSVGAYDPAAGGIRPALFSPSAPWVDLLAPGVRVVSTFLPGQVELVRRNPDGTLTDEGSADFGTPGYATWDGTSFAAANVTGAIAAIVAADQVSAHEALVRLRDPSGTSDIAPHGSL
jgi:subtilisin family serine protease